MAVSSNRQTMRGQCDTSDCVHRLWLGSPTIEPLDQNKFYTVFLIFCSYLNDIVVSVYSAITINVNFEIIWFLNDFLSLAYKTTAMTKFQITYNIRESINL